MGYEYWVYIIISLLILGTSILFKLWTRLTIIIIVPVVLMEFAASVVLAKVSTMNVPDGGSLVMFPGMFLLSFIVFLIVNLFVFPKKDWEETLSKHRN